MPATDVVVEREVAGAIADVFDAWTDPRRMARWLSPTGMAEVSADVRVGGRFEVTMVGGGMRIEHRGEYLAIDPPRLLAFTWQSEYTGPSPGVVTVLLTPRGDHTLVRLTHEHLPDAVVESHRGGWGSILERLGAHLTDVGS